MFQAGKSYKASLISAAITETKAGNPQVHMVFIATEPETKEQQEFHWYGGFTDKGTPITLKALCAAGFIGEDPNVLLETPNEPYFKKADTSIALEEHDGKLRVKWVNSAKKVEAKFTGKLPNLKGALAKVRQEMGIKNTPADPFGL